MAIDKNKHLQCVLESHKMGKVQDLMNKYIAKKTKVKEALSQKYSTQKVSSPIDSGSYAKHTAINIKFDIDICIPFKKTSFSTLEEMYNDVYSYFYEEYQDSDLLRHRIEKQKVSIGLVFNIDGDEIEMDVVPGREINEYLTDQELKLHINTGLRSTVEIEENKEHIKTSIQKHIEMIKGKNPERETIRLLKVWKCNNQVKLKSFLVELLTIEAFKINAEIPLGLWNKLKMTMEYIRDNIETVRLVDPANSNNIVSDSLNSNQKTDLKRRMETMINKIEDNSDNIKIYFPANPTFPCEEAKGYEVSGSAPSEIPRNLGFGQ